MISTLRIKEQKIPIIAIPIVVYISWILFVPPAPSYDKKIIPFEFQ